MQIEERPSEPAAAPPRRDGNRKDFGFASRLSFAAELLRRVNQRLLPGTPEQCVDYFMGLMALSQSPSDPSWGHQTLAEWQRLLAVLLSVGDIPDGKAPQDFFTNDLVPRE